MRSLPVELTLRLLMFGDGRAELNTRSDPAGPTGLATRLSEWALEGSASKGRLGALDDDDILEKTELKKQNGNRTRS